MHVKHKERQGTDTAGGLEVCAMEDDQVVRFALVSHVTQSHG